ncbi:alpha/beta fold hydrolase [Streptomyces sp. 3MP-14]|uniref:Alpha/beta fold hydrolase n=1 Tax=Streptomyces mimosae TaxID=2586635 RepID=A0A5N6A8Z9_9ACTN|nr:MULTISPECIES: alpha/beta hydrolase [Streptomyces]KAB8165111.1 alpha/beta fold hydrolase [Streptomyces mimosae]KAB8175743.1 alpha/beta fold hydrolase [Streptomyces sp. 3MP-14]
MSRPPFLVPPAGVRAHLLATRRGEFAVLDSAPAGPPAGTVLLVPGFTGSKEDFIALLEPLAAAGYRAVAVDGRGQHETPGERARGGYTLGALAEDVLALAEALRAGPVHLLGHSLGGLIGRGAVLRAAAEGRTPFRSLTLLASGPGRVARGQRWRARALVAGLPTLGQRRLWWVLQPKAETTELWNFLRGRWLANAPQQLRATGRVLCYEPDRVDALAATGVPVHVISGEHDAAWPVPELDAMAERLNAHRTVIKGADHSPNAERPTETAEALVAFWNAPR